MRKAHTQKNTLLKNALPVPTHREANAESNFFKRVFFSPPQEKFLPPLLFLIKLFSPPHGLTANSTGTASNVNRFGQSVCGLETVVLRGESKAAHNRKINENF